MDQVAAHQLVERDLPVAVFARRREVLDDPVDPRPELGHLALDVEDERLLAEVGVDDLARSLKADGRIKLGRKIGEGGTLRSPGNGIDSQIRIYPIPMFLPMSVTNEVESVADGATYPR